MSLDDSYDSDNDPKEIDSLLKTALTFSPEYDLNSYDPAIAAPMSGDDFLQYVMYEASKCEKVVSVKLDNLKSKNTDRHEMLTMLKDNIDSKDCSLNTPQCFIPSLEWQNDQINLFSKLRERLEYLRTNYNEKESSNNNLKNVEWLVANCVKYQPSLFEAIRIRQQKVLGFLSSLAAHVENLPADGSSISRHIGAWLYTALALLHTPLLPTTCATLRQLVRKCIQLRAALPVENEHVCEKVEPLNLFICLISRYFNQFDLADKIS